MVSRQEAALGTWPFAVPFILMPALYFYARRIGLQPMEQGSGDSISTKSSRKNIGFKQEKL
jgi:hypothetical protein